MFRKILSAGATLLVLLGMALQLLVIWALFEMHHQPAQSSNSMGMLIIVAVWLYVVVPVTFLTALIKFALAVRGGRGWGWGVAPVLLYLCAMLLSVFSFFARSLYM
jgi:hypothetical protein